MTTWNTALQINNLEAQILRQIAVGITNPLTSNLQGNSFYIAGTDAPPFGTSAIVCRGTGTFLIVDTLNNPLLLVSNTGLVLGGTAPTTVSVRVPNVTPSTDSSTLTANTAFVQSAFTTGTVLNTTNTAITTSNINATVFPTFVTASTGNLPQLVDTGFTYNPLLGDVTISDTLKIQSSTNGSRIAVGFQAGASGQNIDNVAVGIQAGQTTQGTQSTALGAFSGKTSQGLKCVAVGTLSGETSQGLQSTAIGALSGKTSQGLNSVAVGCQAGETTQGIQSVAVGTFSGNTSQGFQATAIGTSSGSTSQGNNGVAVGYQAGETTQGAGAVAIGQGAGQTLQGANSIAIGLQGGLLNQHDRSIILNGSGGALNSDGIDRFFVKPVRGVATATPVIVYNTVTSEITYNVSSIKYKKNVIDVTGDTSAIYNIKAREYDSKDDNTHHIGYIAEELQECDTRFTWKNPDGSPEGIEWFHLLLYTIEEMKKLRERIAVLESK